MNKETIVRSLHPTPGGNVRINITLKTGESWKLIDSILIVRPVSIFGPENSTSTVEITIERN